MGRRAVDVTRPHHGDAWASAAATALLLLGACAPSDPVFTPCTSLADGGGGHGGGVGGGGGAGGSGLTGPDTLVLDVITTGLDDFLTQQPAAGAVVALDLADGRRVEETVGADGGVRFEGLDWSLPGSVAVTAYLPGYLPQSFAGLTATTAAQLAELDGTEVLTAYLLPVDPEMVLLSGAATPVIDPENHVIVVSATTRCSNRPFYAPSWAIAVRASTPTTIIAREWGLGQTPVSPRGHSEVNHQWALLDHDAVSSDETSIDIDFGAPAAVTTVSGSIEIPSHGMSGFFEEGKARAGVRSRDSGGTTTVGIGAWVDVTADGSGIEYDMEHVTPATVELPWTYIRLYRGVTTPDHSGQEQSRLVVPGYPTAGAQAGVLPEPVQLAAAVPVSLGERLTWEMNAVDAADPQLSVQIEIYAPVSGKRRWRLTTPPGTTELTLPAALPSNADPEEALGDSALEAVVEHCEPVLTPEAYRGLCRRWSRSVSVRIYRPAPWGSPQESTP